jgi:hypothetical protein
LIPCGSSMAVINNYVLFILPAALQQFLTSYVRARAASHVEKRAAEAAAAAATTTTTTTLQRPTNHKRIMTARKPNSRIGTNDDVDDDCWHTPHQLCSREQKFAALIWATLTDLLKIDTSCCMIVVVVVISGRPHEKICPN